jgi:methylthioribose-1-phosphate isomerase
MQPNSGRLLEEAVTITEGQKPGVYALDKINFETFGGRTVDPDRSTIAIPRFEIIPEKDIAPIVTEVSVFSQMHWDAMQRHNR